LTAARRHLQMRRSNRGAFSMEPNTADNLLVRYLGDNLQTATLRLVGAALAGSAVLAFLIWII
jgi:hypothetical protein